MDKFMLIQFGAGGMAWLLFIVGLLWCGFAWWRATRCRRSLICVISALTSVISGAVTIIMLVTVSMRFMGPGSSSDSKMIEAIALGLLVLTGVSWAVSSLFFLLAAMKNNYPSPEELAAESPYPTP